MIYLFSSLVSVYVFDDQFRVIKEKKMQDAGASVLLPEEKHLIDLYAKDHEIVVVSEKKEAYRNIRYTQDPIIVNRVLKAARQHLEVFREKNLALTRKQLSEPIMQDLLVVQTIASVADLQKAINLLAKRLRELYAPYAPEVERSIEDHGTLMRCIEGKKTEELLKELGIEESMGASLSSADLDALRSFARSITGLVQEKERKEAYLDALISSCAPNVSGLCGPKIAAKLIAQAGSLRKLAFFPAGTIQMLGAEKALFMHLRKRCDPPKFGILLQHTLVAAAPVRQKGKVARKLADKVSLAARMDYFGSQEEHAGFAMRDALEKEAKRAPRRKQTSEGKHG